MKKQININIPFPVEMRDEDLNDLLTFIKRSLSLARPKKPYPKAIVTIGVSCNNLDLLAIISEVIGLMEQTNVANDITQINARRWKPKSDLGSVMIRIDHDSATSDHPVKKKKKRKKRTSQDPQVSGAVDDVTPSEATYGQNEEINDSIAEDISNGVPDIVDSDSARFVDSVHDIEID